MANLNGLKGNHMAVATPDGILVKNKRDVWRHGRTLPTEEEIKKAFTTSIRLWMWNGKELRISSDHMGHPAAFGPEVYSRWRGIYDVKNKVAECSAPCFDTHYRFAKPSKLMFRALEASFDCTNGIYVTG